MSTLFSLILLGIFPLYVFPYRLPSPLPPKELTLYDVLNLKNHKAKKQLKNKLLSNLRKHTTLLQV